MRLGFTSLYSWRPHTEQMYYLSLLAQQAGHEVRFLECDSDLSTCYIRQMRSHRPGFVECGMCRLGNINTYCKSGISTIGELTRGDDLPVPPNAEAGVLSSASTLGRFESDADYQSAEFLAYADALRPAAQKAYAAARAWIEREKLDGIFLFNGRMDITRSVLEAAQDAGIPYVSMERTWFGDGIQLLPNENCLGLKTIDRMVEEWQDRPLTRQQALIAASHVASRFLRRNKNEWRAYNVDAVKSAWPVENAKRRILLLPGSRNEVWGHADWLGWKNRTDAFDALIDHFKLSPQDLVLRCHPNWGEKIGSMTGIMSEKYYTDWAQKRGVLCIPSSDPTSTMGLIEEADAIAVIGGSAALEAGALGKQVIALGPSWYQKAGFQTTIYSVQDLPGMQFHEDLSETERQAHARNIQKKTLRFCYTAGYRLAQFVPFVRLLTTTQYDYYEGADPARITCLMEAGHLQADDDAYAPHDNEESSVLDIIAAREWEKLETPASLAAGNKMLLHRRGFYQAVDWTRSRLRRGDL